MKLPKNLPAWVYDEIAPLPPQTDEEREANLVAADLEIEEIEQEAAQSLGMTLEQWRAEFGDCNVR